MTNHADHWQEVARIYNEAWRAGDHPTTAVARQLPRPQVRGRQMGQQRAEPDVG